MSGSASAGLTSRLRALWRALRRHGSEASPASDPAAVVDSFAVYAGFMPGGLAGLHGKVVLDVGPGPDLGVALGFMGFGAKVITVDRYPCHWSDAVHAPFYERLLHDFPLRHPGFDFGPLCSVLANREHRTDGLTRLEASLEDLQGVQGGSVDVSHSNATLEHLMDHERALRELGRVTRKGGIGFHQVDLRDHRKDFATPLEHLTLGEAEAASALAKGEHRGYYGSTPRASDYVRWFEAGGFDVRTEVSLHATAAELQRVRPRLHARFRALADDDLAVLSARFHLRKR